MKPENLTGAALDWAAATADNYDEGWLRRQLTNPNPHTRSIPAYSSDWAQGGPIIERERLWVQPEVGKEDTGSAWYAVSMHDTDAYGSTPLIAAMRCYVASKLGPEVEIPNELMEN
jgi:hypothetical protein